MHQSVISREYREAQLFAGSTEFRYPASSTDKETAGPALLAYLLRRWSSEEAERAAMPSGEAGTGAG